MNPVIKFLADILRTGSMIQIGEAENVLLTTGHKDFFNNICDFLEKNKSKNLYFCADVDTRDPMKSVTKDKNLKHPLINRASDIDISRKGYIYFDFDIRKRVEERGFNISDSGIKELAGHFAWMLSKKQWFKNWSYMVYTGNGLHIYYIDEQATPINTEYFGIGYEILRRKMWNILGYQPDPMCKNPARIARLPGSFNNKDKPKPVEIVAKQDNRTKMISIIMRLGEAEAIRLKDISDFEEMLRETRKRENLYNTDELIERINRLPIINEIGKDYPDWTFDGKNFWRNSDGERACSAFVSAKHPNVLIISDSRWFSAISYKGVGTYLYRREMSSMTNGQAIEYFKKEYNL